MLQDDTLLFGLDVDDADIVMEGVVEEEPMPESGLGAMLVEQGGGSSLAALRAENENLKLQARCVRMSRREAWSD